METYQNAEWGTHNHYRLAGGLEKLDHQLSGRDFIVGNAFSIADITAICGIDLAKAVGIDVSEGLTHAHRWYCSVSARPSMAA